MKAKRVFKRIWPLLLALLLVSLPQASAYYASDTIVVSPALTVVWSDGVHSYPGDVGQTLTVQAGVNDGWYAVAARGGNGGNSGGTGAWVKGLVYLSAGAYTLAAGTAGGTGNVYDAGAPGGGRGYNQLTYFGGGGGGYSGILTGGAPMVIAGGGGGTAGNGNGSTLINGRYLTGTDCIAGGDAGKFTAGGAVPAGGWQAPGNNAGAPYPSSPQPASPPATITSAISGGFVAGGTNGDYYRNWATQRFQGNSRGGGGGQIYHEYFEQSVTIGNYSYTINPRYLGTGGFSNYAGSGNDGDGVQGGTLLQGGSTNTATATGPDNNPSTFAGGGGGGYYGGGAGGCCGDGTTTRAWPGGGGGGSSFFANGYVVANGGSFVGTIANNTLADWLDTQIPTASPSAGIVYYAYLGPNDPTNTTYIPNF